MLARNFCHSKIYKFHTVSKSLRNMLNKYAGIPISKIKHIPNGLDLERFKPLSKNKLRSRNNISLKAMVFISIGSFYTWKNQQILIKAAIQLRNNNIPFKMLLVGEGPLEKYLRHLVLSNGLEDYVIFMGYRRDIEELINMSDVLIQPSLTEGMSNTIMEAMGLRKTCNRV